ncbi:MAG: hypothetical protein ABSB82_22365 [Terriglobia bacterium]|jgi:heme/copper-type cytochrome/quinol oxidase subunit 3
MDTEHRRESGLRWILGLASFIFIVFLTAYLSVELVPSEYLGGVDRVRIVSDRISSVGAEAWQFGRPILQLVLILIIFDWLLKRAGLTLDLSTIRLSTDTRAVLALLVVVAFTLAALSGSPGMGPLQDVCLVVLGFYFGGLTKEKAEGATKDTRGSP